MTDATDSRARSEPTRHWGEIDGVSIDFPMVVPRMNSATLTWSVPLDAAAAVIPGEAFEVADMGGTAMLVMALVDYIENPWGDYDEVNFGVLVAPRSKPDAVGAFQWRMPVNQQMTCRAGNEVLGLPKTVEEISFDYGDESVSIELSMDGEPALSLRVPRVEPAGEPNMESSATYSYIGGVATLLPLEIELPPGIVDPSEVELELGTAAVSEELRAMGLPRTPDIAMWGEGLSGTFFWPEPLG